MADLKVALEDLREESDPVDGISARGGAIPRSWKTASGVMRSRDCGAAAARRVVGLWRISRRTVASSHGHSLTRLTSDVGWTDYPAISLDGKMLAYASDRSGEGNLDIWVQQLPGRRSRQADASHRR